MAFLEKRDFHNIFCEKSAINLLKIVLIKTILP